MLSTTKFIDTIDSNEFDKNNSVYMSHKITEYNVIPVAMVYRECTGEATVI